MPRYSLKNLPFPDRLDAKSMVSNLRTAWENFIKIDSFNTLSVTAAGATVITAISQTIFTNCAAGNVALTVATAVGNTGLTYTIFKTDSTTNTLTVNGYVLGGNLGASRIVLVSDGTVYRVRELYEEGTFTATLTGFASGPTQTVYYVRNGKSVTLRYASFTGTSNATTMTVTGLPSHLYPVSAAVTFFASVRDNGLDYVGTCSISTAGVWTVFFQNTISSSTNVFTNSGTKGLVSNNATYSTQ